MAAESVHRHNPSGSQSRTRLSGASSSLGSALVSSSEGGCVLWSFVYLVVRNLFALVWLLGCPRRSKELEILVLRQELAILRPRSSRPTLTPAQGRARTRSLRRTQRRRLPPPHRARHLRARLPHPRASMPPARGRPTLPQTVLLLQPLLRCWAGRCRTCNQPVELNQLTLFHRRE